MPVKTTPGTEKGHWAKWEQLGRALACLLIVTVALSLVAALADDDPPSGQDGPPATGSEEGQDSDQRKEEEPKRYERPDTSEKEREEKLRRNRQDPFINPPSGLGPGGGVREFYNPADWLRTEVVSDLSQYMVQDDDGEVVGYLAIDIVLEQDPMLGEFIHLTKAANYDSELRVEAWLYADTFKPRRVTHQRQPFSEGVDETAILLEYLPGMDVDYLFDRVSVEYHEGGISSWVTFRQLPFSFDMDEVALLVRQLDFLNTDWPFEAYVTDPASRLNLPLAIAKPERCKMISAEPVDYNCHEVVTQIGDVLQSWWVERLPPNRLIRFKDDTYTYTLISYMEHE